MSTASSTPDGYLISLGWTSGFQSSFAAHANDGLRPARVMGQGRGHYQIQATPDGTFEAAITTKLHEGIKDPAGFPTVGDWVTFDFRDGTAQATIHHVLERQNLIQREKIGARQGVQLVAANADSVLAVTSIEGELDLDKLGRFVALGRTAGCPTVVVLTKADLCADVENKMRGVRGAFGDLEVFAISTHRSESIYPLEHYFAAGRTAVLVGPSGAGKSTLTNYLLGGEVQKTQALSGNAKGRHTTTARTLCPTRFGGLVMDTPGMQDVSVGDVDEVPSAEFTDLDEAVLRCKFTTCRHEGDPGCAVASLIKGGELTVDRWQAYLSAKAKTQRRTKPSRQKYKR